MSVSKEQLISYLESLKKEYDEKAAFLFNMEADTPVRNIYEDKKKEYDEVIMKLREENETQLKEMSYLKDLVKRFNKQLNRYLEKLGPLSESEYIDKVDYSEGTLDSRSVYKINSLLLAYDEVIQEQNASLAQLRRLSESALEKVKILQKENEEAYKYIEAMNSEPGGDGQTKHIVADAKLLVEERELLLKEVSLLQQKKRQSESEFQKLDALLQGSREKEKTLKREIENQKCQITSLSEQNERLKLEISNSVKEEEHKKAVEQCSKLLEKLKKVHNQESIHMKKRVQQIKSNQQNLVAKLTQSSKKFQVINKETIGYKTYIRNSHSKLRQQSESITNLKKSRKILESKLRDVVRIMSGLIQDRKILLQNIQNYKKEAIKNSQIAQNHSVSLGKLAIKMKEDRLHWSRILAEKEGKLQASEEAWNRSVADAQRLRKLLQQKDTDFKEFFSQFSQNHTMS